MDPVRLLWDGLNRLVAAVALILLSPVILVVAAWIRIADGKGILFVQDRAGRDGVPFRMWKFRTMVHDSVALSAQARHQRPVRPGRGRPADHPLRPVPAPHQPGRAAPAGERAARADEPGRVPGRTCCRRSRNYSADDRRRLAVKPGITGWAQINGRDDIDWPQRFVLDRWYVDHWSPALDLRILWRTVATLRRDEAPVRVDELNIQRAQDASRAA